MLNKARFGLLAVAMMGTGCVVMQGGEVVNPAPAVAADTKNNDDYYEIHKDGRIYVLADADGYKLWLKTGEIPLVVTQIGVGPHGETVKLALTKAEAKAMESKVGYHGGAQNLFENKIDGIEKGFFGFVANDDGYFVFDNWKQLDAFRKGGSVPAGAQTVSGGAPDGKNVVYAVKSDELVTRFKALNSVN
jgi:hypothetical protein